MYAGGGLIIEVRLLCCVPGRSWKPGCGPELADATFESFAFILSLAGSMIGWEALWVLPCPRCSKTKSVAAVVPCACLVYIAC